MMVAMMMITMMMIWTGVELICIRKNIQQKFTSLAQICLTKKAHIEYYVCCHLISVIKNIFD